ncbi:ferredoxin [Streptomyces fulvoviolaceus]|uniref:ferredoxin n=1 Tax=Streptomyces fulvoviolaceus TaxID=285535 RepID=UPI0004C56070|nr:ferredoxin [Streptomyces fulvoviolaceus]MCT9079630.1 ferredoxin [Streptomyces fulvoviolaceus]
MKVTVDDDSCRGHGVCCTLCPEVFDLSDDGYAVVETPDVPAEFEDAVRSAAGMCPEHAITVS